MKNNETTENNIPKFNIPSQMNYGSVMDFEPLDGSQIMREVVTDTYVTASENEDEMVKRIDEAASILKGKTRGFAGYLSFYYIQLTLFYILKKYELCEAAIEKIRYGITSVERFIFTGNYLDANGNDSGFVNYAFGEDDSELKQTTKYLHDAWCTAKLIHRKAMSFESGFSLLVASLMLHSYNKQLGMMREDCEKLRSLTDQLSAFIKNESKPEGETINSSEDLSFANIEDLKKE